MTHKFTNQLIHESSPYLLQHAHNPVDWYPWNDVTLAKAKSENKLLLISIGYSACHWCHVMEHECFEDETVAEIMNKNFICIKVDREERPDIDQVYMNAVQLMTGRGGWPLNCIALADGRPIYGGTYFPKTQWISILNNLVELFKKDRAKVMEYAAKLTEGVQQSELISPNLGKQNFTVQELETLCAEWSLRFDQYEGGPDKAPKFPLPNNYQFLLRYATLAKDTAILNHVHLTLKKIAYGGIYDHVGGGFARYSVDANWKVPHFEKMLYDNAQLVSLYSEAYQSNQDPLYKQVALETLRFIERELTSPEGAFYSALDADSEGEEGKYYVWTKEEIENILENDFEIFAAFYNVNDKGYWEHGNYILLRNESLSNVAIQQKVTEKELSDLLENCKTKLLLEREKRVRPGLDDKILCSWNALMVKAYLDAYKVFGDENYLKTARKALTFLQSKMSAVNGNLLHNYKNGKATLNGFLEDYAFVIEAQLAMYACTFEEVHLQDAKKLMELCTADFFDEASGYFFFTSVKDSPLIARKMETSDNVIPASNSSIAKSLFLLGKYFDDADFISKSLQMLHHIKHLMQRYGAGYSNWAQIHLMQVFPFYELAIVGEKAEELRKELEVHYLPNVVLLGSKSESQLPLLQNKFTADKSWVYLCSSNTCKQPVESIDAALGQME